MPHDKSAPMPALPMQLLGKANSCTLRETSHPNHPKTQKKNWLEPHLTRDKFTSKPRVGLSSTNLLIQIWICLKTGFTKGKVVMNHSIFGGHLFRQSHLGGALQLRLRFCESHFHQLALQACTQNPPVSTGNLGKSGTKMGYGFHSKLVYKLPEAPANPSYVRPYASWTHKPR